MDWVAEAGLSEAKEAPATRRIFTWGKLPACRRSIKTQFFWKPDKLEAYPTLNQNLTSWKLIPRKINNPLARWRPAGVFGRILPDHRSVELNYRFVIVDTKLAAGINEWLKHPTI